MASGILRLLALAVLLSIPAWGAERFNAQARATTGEVSNGATITVFDSGTVNLSSLFSDSALTLVKANPFTANADGSHFFYAADGTYDIQWTLGTPVTGTSPYAAISLGTGGSHPVSTVFTRSGAVVAATGDYTAAQVTDAFSTNSNNDWNGFYQDLDPISTPSTPATDTVRLFAQSDSLWIRDDTGATFDLAGASGAHDIRSHGALCDGSTDDATAIQAANDAAEAAGGGVVSFPEGDCRIASQLNVDAPNITWRGDGYGATTLKANNSTNIDYLVRLVDTSNFTLRGINFDCNRLNQSSGENEAIFFRNSYNVKLLDSKIQMCGLLLAKTAVRVQNTSNVDVTGNYFASNFGHDILAQNTVDTNSGDGLRITNNQFGASAATEANTKVTWQDTQGAGAVSVSTLGVNECVFSNNTVNGARRSADASTIRNGLVSVSQASNCTVADNSFTGMSNAYSTINVTNGSGTILCNDTNCFFSTVVGTNRNTEIGSFLTVEGDSTLYQVTSVVDQEELVVTPVMVRTTNTDLRYRMNYSADLFSINGENNVVDGNTFNFSHDVGMTLSAQSEDAVGNAVTNNTIANSCTHNLLVFCSANDCFNNVIANNTVKNAGQCSAIITETSGIHLFTGGTASTTIQRNIIANNNIFDDQGSPTQEDGIGCTSCDEVDNNHILGNRFDANNSERIASGISITSNTIALNKDLDGGVATTTHAAESAFIKALRHASDCTAITDGKDGEVCWEQDANTFYVCESPEGAEGICDVAGEWIASAAVATTIDALGDSVGAGVVAVADDAQIWNWNSPATAVAKDAMTFNYTLDASSDAATQRVVVVARPASSGTATLEVLLDLENLDTDGAVEDAIRIRSLGGGITTAIDMNDADITTILQTVDSALTSLDLDLLDDTTITLITETTGDHVKDVADGTGIDGTATGEGSTYTPVLDLTEITGPTWSAGTTITETYDGSGGTDVSFVYDAGVGTLTTGNMGIAQGSYSAGTHTLMWVRKDSAGTINPGEAVYIVGYNAGQDVPTVELADADNSAAMPAVGIALESFTNGASGRVVIAGRLPGQDTSSFTIADELYISTTAGTLTATKPTGAGTEVQKGGIVLRSHASLGVIEVLSSGESFDAILTVGEGGTGAGTFTGLLRGNGTSAFTVITDSSTVGQVLRVTGASTYAWGALDLADSDAVTGLLDEANLDANVVLDNASNTYSTGAQNLTNATSLIIPTRPGLGPTANGQIAYDTTSNTLEYGDAAVNRVVANLDEAQTFTSKTLDGATGTGVIDFGGATSFEIPNGTAPVVDTAGEIGNDTTDDQLLMAVGSTARVIEQDIKSTCMVHNNLAAADDDTPMPIRSGQKITLISAFCHCNLGTCSTEADLSFEYAEVGSATITDVTGTVTCEDTTTGDTLTTLSGNVDIEALDLLRYDVDNAVSPETDTYAVCVNYRLFRN